MLEREVARLREQAALTTSDAATARVQDGFATVNTRMGQILALLPGPTGAIMCSIRSRG